MYDRAVSQTAGGDGGRVGQRAHHISLQNIGVDQIHGSGVPL